MKQIIIKLLGSNNIYKIRYLLSGIYSNKFKDIKNKKKILLTLIPIHGNLGDHAIAYAAIKYLKDKFPQYEIIEVNLSETYKYGKCLEKIMNQDDMIFILGGGNMGNQYIIEENVRRHIIKNFKRNKIISLPQTMYFTNDESGKSELEISKKIYNSNKNLTIIGRENKSYKSMKDNFINCKVIKCPDIVFYLNNKLNLENIDRTNIMTCLRKDKETYIPIDKKEIFLQDLKNKYKNLIITDTVINESVNKEQREQKLYELWKKFYKSKVVITDRLHGMIFCAITKTPCIITRSLDHKVLGSYEWIKNLNYIRIVEDLEFKNIEPIIEELISLNQIDEFNFDEVHFNELLEKIN